MHATLSATTVAANRWQRWFLVALVLLFVGVGVQYTIKISGGNDHRSAFLRWRGQILDLDHGVRIYDEHNYPNPPIMALMLWPLAALPPLVGAHAWFWLKAGMALLIYHWVFRLVREPGRPFPVWAQALAVALSIRPIVGDLTHGNVNIFIFFLVVAALMAFRGGRDVRAGLWLGLAIACKITPALFVPYFLWKRAWAALAGCAAGLILFWWLLPGLVLGFERNDRLFAEWADNMIVPYVVHGKVTTEHQNQSLPGLVHRLLTRGPSFSEWDDAIRGYVPVEYDNILDVHPALAGLLVKFCMAAFAAAVVWSCRTPIAQRQRSQLAAEYALVVLGMLLFSERTWKHHCVSLVLPLAVLAYRLADGRVPARGRRAIVAALATAWLLMTLTGTGLFGSALDHVARIFEVYGTYVWAYVVLAAAVVCLLRAPAHRALQPPHVGLLRGWSKTPTLTARSEGDPERGQFHDEQAESICHPRDPGRRFDPHS